MRLKTAFFLYSSMGLLLVIVTGGALDIITTEMHHAILDHRRAQRVSLALDHIEIRLRDSERSTALWTISHSPQYLRQRDLASDDLVNTLRATQLARQGTPDQAMLAAVERRISDFLNTQARTRPLRKGQDAYAVLGPLRASFDRAISSLVDAHHTNEAELDAIESSSRSNESLSNWIARGAEATAVILFGAMAWFLYFALYTPLTLLVRSIVNYRNGERGSRTPLDSFRIEEVKQAARSFNTLADKLDAMEQDRFRFLAGTVHDIRNPLTVLKTAASVLRTRPGAAGNEDSRLLKMIDEQVERLRKMVDELIDRQQIQSGRLALRLEEHDLIPLVEEVISLWEVAARGHRIALHRPRERLLIPCDSHRLQQALNNLMSNATKYSPDGGEIDVRIRTHDLRVAISVTDQGMGISEEDQKRIFEPYLRGRAVPDFIPGTGLGLFSSRKIVEAHGGTIRVESALGRGTTFTIELPRTQPASRVA